MELWVEKYRPTTLEEYVGNETIKSKIADYLKQGSIQNLLFHGVAGTGKTTLARLIVNQLNCDVLYINASDERGIDTIREKIIPFASTVSFLDVKIVFINDIKNTNIPKGHIRIHAILVLLFQLLNIDMILGSSIFQLIIQSIIKVKIAPINK